NAANSIPRSIHDSAPQLRPQPLIPARNRRNCENRARQGQHSSACHDDAICDLHFITSTESTSWSDMSLSEVKLPRITILSRPLPFGIVNTGAPDTSVLATGSST